MARGPVAGRLTDLILRFRWWVVALTLAATGLLGYLAAGLTTNNNYDTWLPENDRVAALFQETDREFSSNALVFVVLAFPERGVFHPDSLAEVRRFTELLESVPELFYVMSLSNIVDLKSVEDGISVGKLFEEVPEDPGALEAMRDYVLAKEMYRNTVVSADGRYTAILMNIDGRYDEVEVASRVLERLKENAGETRYFFGGDPALAHYMDIYMGQDMERLLPLTFLIMTVILYLGLRRFWGVVLPLSMVVLSIIWTLGFQRIFDMPLNLLTPAVMVLLIALGSDYAVHVLNHYLRVGDLRRGTNEIALPVLMSALTTVAGLLTFGTTHIRILSDFGFELAFGIGAACLLSLTVLIAMTAIVRLKPEAGWETGEAGANGPDRGNGPSPHGPAGAESGGRAGNSPGKPDAPALRGRSGAENRGTGESGHGKPDAPALRGQAGTKTPGPAGSGPEGQGSGEAPLFGRVVEKLTVRVLRHRWLFLAGVALVLVLMGLGIPRIHTNVDIVTFVPADSPPRQGHEILQGHFGGIYPVSLYFRGEIEEPSLLRLQLRAENLLRKNPKLSGFTSVASLVAEMNRLLTGVYAIPEDRAGVANLWLLMEGEPYLKPLVNEERDKALLTAMIGESATEVMKGMAGFVEEELRLGRPDELLTIDLARLPPETRSRLVGLQAEDAAEQLASLAAGYAGSPVQPAAAFRERIESARPEARRLSWSEGIERTLRSYLSREAVRELSQPVAEELLGTLRRFAREGSPAEAWGPEVRRLLAEKGGLEAEEARILEEGVCYRFRGELRKGQAARYEEAALAGLPEPLRQNPDFLRRARGVLWEVTGTRPVFPRSACEGVPGLDEAAVKRVPFELDHTGAPSIFRRFDQLLFTSQAQSLVLATLVVFLMVAFTQRSWKRGLISTVAVLVPLEIVIGFMGWMGIPLDFGSALFGALVIGVGIDGCIHVLYYEARIRAECRSEDESLVRTLRHVGRAVLTANLTTAAGFGTLVFSAASAIRNFALLNVIAISLVTVSVLTLLPVLIKLSHVFAAPPRRGAGGNPGRASLLRLFLLFALGASIATGVGCHSAGEAGTEAAAGDFIPFTVMTYNVLFAVPNPEFDPWEIRKSHVAEAIRGYAPDLLGLQEPLPWQVTDLLALCPGYREFHWDIDTDATLFYREDRFEVLESGSYWLSPTPDVPWSVGFGNFFPRLVIWNRMRDLESGLAFFQINTHFDNTSPSQEMSAPLFLERAAPLADQAPVIVTGDFNSRPSSEAYRMLTSGVEEVREGAFRLADTFSLDQGFEVIAGEGEETDHDRTGRIDHVFVAGGPFSCQRWIVDKTGYGDQGKVPSDHYPVITRIRLAR